MDIFQIAGLIVGLLAVAFCTLNAVTAESFGKRIAWIVAIPLAFVAGIFLLGIVGAILIIWFILWLIFEVLEN
jgi:hypothetical protein